MGRPGRAEPGTHTQRVIVCGRESADDAAFCARCGAAFAPAREAREERKVVSIVFVDLVGSTARAEQLDPEDVRAALASYHARVRVELEQFGGTVEKFSGDVIALFQRVGATTYLGRAAAPLQATA